MSGHQVENISSKQPLTTAVLMGRFGTIGAALLCVAVAFAYTGGWLSPSRRGALPRSHPP